MLMIRRVTWRFRRSTSKRSAESTRLFLRQLPSGAGLDSCTAERTEGSARRVRRVVHGGTVFHAPAVSQQARRPFGQRRSAHGRERLSPRPAYSPRVPHDRSGRALPIPYDPLSHPHGPERPASDGCAGFFFFPRAQDVPESDGLLWRRNLSSGSMVTSVPRVRMRLR